jgi:hypothetical protein
MNTSIAATTPFIFHGRRSNSRGVSPSPSPGPSDTSALPVNMSFAFDDDAPSSSPAPTERDDGDYDDAMEMEFDAVHGKLSKLELSDTDMEDSDSDSNFATDSDTDSEPSDEDDADDDAEDDDQLPLGGSEDEDADMTANPHIPPHFASPHYDAWLAAQTPNVIFTLRIKPLLAGSMIAAHSIRLWYRDFRGRDAFLQAIVDEYQLLDVNEISGFIVKERRTKTWAECGADEQSWNIVLGRIRNKYADENLTGSGMAVRAELKVLVGGGDELKGKVVEKGRYPEVELLDDPDL